MKYVQVLLIYCFQVLPLSLSSEWTVTDAAVMVLSSVHGLVSVVKGQANNFNQHHAGQYCPYSEIPIKESHLIMSVVFIMSNANLFLIIKIFHAVLNQRTFAVLPNQIRDMKAKPALVNCQFLPICVAVLLSPALSETDSPLEQDCGPTDPAVQASDLPTRTPFHVLVPAAQSALGKLLLHTSCIFFF